MGPPPLAASPPSFFPPNKLREVVDSVLTFDDGAKALALEMRMAVERIEKFIVGLGMMYD
jgi:hypothetical protein